RDDEIREPLDEREFRCREELRHEFLSLPARIISERMSAGVRPARKRRRMRGDRRNSEDAHDLSSSEVLCGHTYLVGTRSVSLRSREDAPTYSVRAPGAACHAES